ncbi:hypothetical protein VTG60DRAFT_501 [Thermothelomyces hinnuleus]
MQLTLHITPVSVSFPLPSMSRSPVVCQPVPPLVIHRGRSKLFALAAGTLGKRLDSLQGSELRLCFVASFHPGGSAGSHAAPGFQLFFFLFCPAGLCPPALHPAIHANFGTQAISNKGTPAPDKKARSSSRPGATRHHYPFPPPSPPPPADPHFFALYLFAHSAYFPATPRGFSSQLVTHITGFSGRREFACTYGSESRHHGLPSPGQQLDG